MAGSLTLDGALEVSLADDYVPEAGDEFDVLDWSGALNTEFAHVSFDPLPDGLSWDDSRLYDEGVLAIDGNFSAADFDEDADVDGDDLTRWRNNFATGTTHMQGDADGDNDADGADFLVWQRQLGSPPSAIAANAPVPEPATLVLLVAGALPMFFRRRPAVS